MISFFRRFIDSKIGPWIMLSILGVIALAFALGDITGSGGVGAIAGGGSTVAKVGGDTVDTGSLNDRIKRVLERERQQNPQATMAQLLAQNVVDDVLDQLIASTAIMQFSKDQGLTASTRMVDREIAQIQAFQGADGRFNQDMFRQQLQRQNISEAALREDISKTLLGQQLLGPAGIGAKLTNSMVLPYASLLLEQRQGRVAMIPATLFAPTTKPDARTLAAFYAANATRYTVPEQRVLRYAVIDETRFIAATNPTDAEVQAYYAKNKARYASNETRNFERLILPTEAGAKAIAAQVAGGVTLSAAAQKAGLAVSNLVSISRTTMTEQTSADVAAKTFAVAKGGLAGPVRTPLGWALFKVTDIIVTPGQTVDQAREGILTAIRAEKSHQLLSDFTAKLEDQAQDGATFDEIVRTNGLKVETTPALMATGKSVEVENYSPTADAQAIVSPGFDQEVDGDPVLAPITNDKRYALVDVVRVIPAAPPPLAKVQAVIERQWQLSEGAKRAKAAAEAIKAKVSRGMTLDAALAQAGVKLPAPQVVGGRRADLMRGGQQIPPALSLMFSIPAGSTKVLDAGQGQGYFIVHLDAIKAGDAGGNPQLVEATRAQLQSAAGGEYAEQFERAIEAMLEVTKYPKAIEAAKATLRRENGG